MSPYKLNILNPTSQIVVFKALVYIGTNAFRYVGGLIREVRRELVKHEEDGLRESLTRTRKFQKSLDVC